jgi:hypothetical protein
VTLEGRAAPFPADAAAALAAGKDQFMVVSAMAGG